MNINVLKDCIDQFNSEIINSGFKRDLQDYLVSLRNNQNNIVVLREVANDMRTKLEKIYNNDLPENLAKLLIQDVKPFTTTNVSKMLHELLNDKQIEQTNFFQKLNRILVQLNRSIDQNIVEVNKIEAFVKPYIDTQKDTLSSEEKAIISIIFKNKKTIKNLKEFINNLQNWNKILPLYHQVLTSSSPEDIEIVNIQNGSIDLLINLDIDLALNLAEVFEYGYKALFTYLSYKQMVKPIIAGYLGNKKLIAGEKEREKELINNIGDAVKSKINEQHIKALETDKEIEKNSNKMIEQVVKLITSHILSGNDFKLLAIPENTGTNENVKTDNSKKELNKISTQVKQAVKTLPKEDMKKLLERYNEPTENDSK